MHTSIRIMILCLAGLPCALRMQVKCRLEGVPGVEMCVYYDFGDSAALQAAELEAAEVHI